MLEFSAKLEILVGNPFVFVPSEILNEVFKQANKDNGAISIRGKLNNVPYQQTLVKYSGSWRLYVNMQMLKNSPKRIGEIIHLSIEFDPSDRTIEIHPKLIAALSDNKVAKKVFDSLSPSKQKEIVRYISFLKTEASVDRNVEKAIQYLLGNGRFVGRGSPY